jgi:folylpolyglutamate synthase/dihydropteroate synthase
MRISFKLPEFNSTQIINLFLPSTENFNGLLKNSQLDRCIHHKEIWQKLSPQSDNESQLSVCPTITSALEIINDIKDNNFPTHINVLLTGSLHLVGSSLQALNDVKEMNLKTPVKVKRLKS